MGEVEPGRSISAFGTRVRSNGSSVAAPRTSFPPDPGIEQPVGEDMPPFPVGGQLRLVQRDEGMAATGAVHRFRRAQEIARTGRFYPFLASDQGDLFLALYRHDAVIHFAREQAQREAYHPARMAAHPFDGEMCLAGIGGSEDRLDRGVAHLHCLALCARYRKSPVTPFDSSPIPPRPSGIKSTLTLILQAGLAQGLPDRVVKTTTAWQAPLGRRA